MRLAMLRSTIRSLAPLSLLVSVAAAGCGAEPQRPVTASDQPALSTDSGPRDEAAMRHQIGGRERIPSPKLIDRRARSAVASDSLGLVENSARPPQNSAALYRAVAPATVIVRVAGGIGSGVVIDPAGWVLTNHHVVALGESEDFRLKVSVLLGELSGETGGMVRQQKTYEAVVYKADKLRDLALIKLLDPPKSLPFVRLAKQNPVPGQQVISIGHAGAGMLWAIKPGEVSALGKLSEQLAALAQFKDDESGKEASDSFKKYLDGKNLGLVIQSTCNILPGDSGGPLVTKTGELVGLNAFSNKDPRTGGLLNFHIHRDELAKFVKQRPKKPAQLVPDPWKEGGGDASYEDADLDGSVDVLLMEGRRACSFCPRQSAAVFMDLDQSTYKSSPDLPPLKDVFEKQSFDAELVYLQLENDAFVWYDSDDDGAFDVLLVDSGTTGRSSSAYRIQPDGELVKDSALASGRVIRTALFKQSHLHPRLARVARAAFPEHYLEAASAPGDLLPEPIGTTGTGQATDLDFDGVRDTLRVETAFSMRLLIDVDQSSIGSLPAEISLAKLGTNKLDAEVAIVSQSTHMWVWYDSDDDGRMDLVLHSPGTRLYVAANAWKVDAAGNKTAATEQIGRKLIRHSVLPAGTMATRFSRIVDKHFLPIMSEKGSDGLASFPDPIADHRGTGFELMNLKGAHKSVVVVHGQGSDGYLVDFEGTSLPDKPKPGELQKAMEAGKFDAEYAYFQRNGLAWAYFDTSNKRRYDVVLYSSDPRGGKADHGFRIADDGRVTLDTALAGRPLAAHSLFSAKRDQKKMEKLAKELFGARALE
jgi:S1-C subfamily serine protease